MLGDPGLYYIYRRYIQDGREEKRLLGKVLILGTSVKVLEDHDGSISQSFPPGPLSGAIIKRMVMMDHSSYFSIVHEADLLNGKSLDDIPELTMPEQQQWTDDKDE